MTTPIRTSRADRNILSWSGDTLQWFLGTDSSQPCARTPDEVLPPEGTTVADWDSALKVSGNTYGVHVEGIAAAPCRENVLDINHSEDVTFLRAQLGREGEIGDQVITIKGGSNHVEIGGTIHSCGRHGDAILGMWSDQSTDPVHHLDLVGLKRADGKPVTVVFVRADRRTIALPANVKVLKLKGATYTAYWWLKRAYVAALSLFRRSIP